MSRICVPGLLAFLAVAPLGVRGADEGVDLPGGIAAEVEADVAIIAEAKEAAAEAPEVIEVEAGEGFEIDVVLDPFVIADGDGDGEEKSGESATKLAAEDEKLLSEFVKKAAAVRQKQLTSLMEKRTAEMVNELKLDPDTQKKLEALTGPAVEATQEKWEGKCRDWLVPFISRNNTGAAETLKNWKPEQIAANNNFGGVAAPDQTDAWKEGVAKILSEEQLKRQEEMEARRMAKLREEMADYLAASEAQAGEVMDRSMGVVVGRILQYGEVDEERQKKLKAAAAEAVKTTVAEWRKRVEKQLLDTDESSREQMTRRGGVMGVNTTDKENQPQEQKVWTDAVAQILTDAERRKIEDRRMELRARRAEALSIVLVTDLDRLVGFSEPQRNALLEMMNKPLQGLPDTYFETPENGYYSIDMTEMMKKAGEIEEARIAALLDGGQLKRWKAVNPSQLRNSYVRERIDAGKLPKPEDIDEVEMERILSGFLHREARKMKQRMQSIMESRVENIQRVASPSPETVAVLTTAAKGAAEEMAQGSIGNLTGWVRGQFQNVKPADVPARLQNLYNPYFNDRQAPVEPELWTASVERSLSDPQREAWKAECASRELWRMRGLTSMVMTELEKRMTLKPEQREALQKKMAAVIDDYDADFANFFSYGWHLQGYYSMIPLAMLEEKELLEFFDKKEIDTLKEKCLGNSLQYVDMIRRNHKSRAKK